MNQIKSRDFVKEPLQVLSYGGGVQSTAMIFLIKEGKLPKPDIVIHSDTGSEMPYTEEMVLSISKIVEEMGIPFEIVTSNHGRLHEYYFSKKTVPVVGVRSCTVNFKILPQRRKIREIVGKGNGKLLAECWLGITTDESRRKIDSELQWIGNKFPLLDLDISRKDCIEINKNMDLKSRSLDALFVLMVGKNGLFDYSKTIQIYLKYVKKWKRNTNQHEKLNWV